MSTHAAISYVIAPDKVCSIYVHFDGYLSELGKMLQENYNDEVKVEELISNGDASYVDKTIESSCFYYRDRNEELHVNKSGSILEARLNYRNVVSYHYVWDEGRWNLLAGDGKYIPLRTELLGTDSL